MIADFNCRFCQIAAVQRHAGDIDKPILESDDYIAIASIGAFIEGWCLVIPKKHKLTLAHDYRNQAFLEFASQVSERVSRRYGNTIFFEHGPITTGSAMGCGINHAHLHIVPFKESISETILNGELIWSEIPVSAIEDKTALKDYLLYSDDLLSSEPIVLLSTPHKPISQYFRMVLAEKTGFMETANYRAHSHMDISIETHKQLALA